MINTTQIILIVLLVVLLLVAFAVVYFKKFKHIVILKEITGNRTQTTIDKAREYKDRNGVVWWSLFKKRKRATIPPPEAISLTPKGKKVVEGYFSEDGDIRWTKDEIQEENIIGHQPLTSTDRVILVEEIARAEARKKPNLLDKLIQLAPAVMLVIFLVLILAFWQEVWTPAVQMGATLDGVSGNIADITKEQAKLMSYITRNIDGATEEIPAAPD